MKHLTIILAFFMALGTHVKAADTISILCEAGKWTGQRIGFLEDGQIENNGNGQYMKETLFILDSLPPKKGDRVRSSYGADFKYEGEVRYYYSGEKPYIIIETQPYQIQENYTIDLVTGDAILTITKRMWGFYKDNFIGKCFILN